jgi:hypothetical protein
MPNLPRFPRGLYPSSEEAVPTPCSRRGCTPSAQDPRGTMAGVQWTLSMAPGTDMPAKKRDFCRDPKQAQGLYRIGTLLAEPFDGCRGPMQSSALRGSGEVFAIHGSTRRPTCCLRHAQGVHVLAALWYGKHCTRCYTLHRASCTRHHAVSWMDFVLFCTLYYRLNRAQPGLGDLIGLFPGRDSWAEIKCCGTSLHSVAFHSGCHFLFDQRVYSGLDG